MTYTVRAHDAAHHLMVAQVDIDTALTCHEAAFGHATIYDDADGQPACMAAYGNMGACECHRCIAAAPSAAQAVVSAVSCDEPFRLRSAFDAAEFGLIAARATLLGLKSAADAKSWDLSEPEHHAIRCAEEAIKQTTRKLDEARKACETRNIIVSAHPARSLL